MVLGVWRVPALQCAIALPYLLWIGRTSEMVMLVTLSIWYTWALNKCKYIPEPIKVRARKYVNSELGYTHDKKINPRQP